MGFVLCLCANRGDEFVAQGIFLLHDDRINVAVPPRNKEETPYEG